MGTYHLGLGTYRLAIDPYLLAIGPYRLTIGTYCLAVRSIVLCVESVAANNIEASSAFVRALPYHHKGIMHHDLRSPSKEQQCAEAFNGPTAMPMD